VHRRKAVAEKSALNTIASCIHAWAECAHDCAPRLPDRRSFGVALMTNGEGGRPLIPEFVDATFAAYGQEPFRPAD